SCTLRSSADDPANQQSFTGGWFRTGDIGLIDREGYVFIKGRAKEFINRGGVKISPHEIEGVLLEHPNVAEAVVFAIPESRLGEEVAAAIVLREPRPTAADAVRALAPRRRSYSKIPKRLVVLGEVSKGTSGRLERIGVAARVRKAREGRLKYDPRCETRTALEYGLFIGSAEYTSRERIGVD